MVLEVLHVGVAETFAAAVTATAVAVAVAMNVAVAISVATGEAVVGGPHGSRCVVLLVRVRLMMLLRLMLMLLLPLLLLLMLESVRVLELMVRGVGVRRPVLPVGAQRGVHRGAGGRSVVAAAVPISILIPVAAMLLRAFPRPLFESPYAEDVLLPRRRPQHQPARWHAVRRPFCPFHANVYPDQAVVLIVARASARVHHRAGAVGTVPWRVHRGPERSVVHVHRMRRRRVARHPVAGIRHTYHSNTVTTSGSNT